MRGDADRRQHHRQRIAVGIGIIGKEPRHDLAQAPPSTMPYASSTAMGERFGTEVSSRVVAALLTPYRVRDLIDEAIGPARLLVCSYLNAPRG